MRCVFDTNVLVSALLIPDSMPRRAFDRALAKDEILLSFALLAELSEVLSRKQFRRYVDEEDVRRFLAALTQAGEWVEVNIEIKICRDPDDDRILELAASGSASYIVTGDADLLVLNPFRGMQIVTPRAFLNL